MQTIEKLIECVFQRPDLWDQSSKSYHNRDVSRKLWNEVADECHMTSLLVKTKWRGLRDTFRRELHKIEKAKAFATGVEEEEELANSSRWPFFRNMRFLKDQIGSRKNNDHPTCGVVNRRSHRRKPKSIGPQVHLIPSKQDYSQFSGQDFRDVEMDETDDLHTLIQATEQEKIFDQSVMQAAENENILNGIKPAEEQVNFAHETFVVTAKEKDSLIRNNGESQQALNVTRNLLNTTAQHSVYRPHKSTNTVAVVDMYDRILEINDSIKSAENEDGNWQGNKKGHLEDEDYHFAMSILPSLRRIPTQRKNLLRLQVLQIIMQEEQAVQTQNLVQSEYQQDQMTSTAHSCSSQPPHQPYNAATTSSSVIIAS